MRYPLKWDPRVTKVPDLAVVDFDRIPAAARRQAVRFVQLCANNGDAAWIAGPLAYAANAVRPFDPYKFYELTGNGNDGPAGFNRFGWISALDLLSKKYPDIPEILWDVIAIMGLRPAPHVEEGIPNLGALLLHDWALSDAALHAAALATAFWSDINYELERQSGCYAEHGCDCNHILRALPRGARFPPMPADRQPDITREWWCHFMAQLVSIYVDGLLFVLNERIETYAGTMVLAEG